MNGLTITLIIVIGIPAYLTAVFLWLYIVTKADFGEDDRRSRLISLWLSPLAPLLLPPFVVVSILSYLDDTY